MLCIARLIPCNTSRSLRFVAVAFAIGLTGCANLQNEIKERHEAQELAYVNKAKESCKRYGFTENTETFSQCIQNEVNATKARRRTTTSCWQTTGGMDCTTSPP